jgi:hypothetical protein
MFLSVCFYQLMMQFPLKKTGLEKNPHPHATPEFKDTTIISCWFFLRQLLNKKKERRCRPKLSAGYYKTILGMTP